MHLTACRAQWVGQLKAGYVKMIVDDSTNTLLGIRAVGEDSSSLIQTAALMIKDKTPVSSVANVLYPHPSTVEAFLECIRMLDGKSIHKVDDRKNFI